MAITRVQSAQGTAGAGTTVAKVYAGAVVSGNLLVCAVGTNTNGSSILITGVSDTVNGAWTKAASNNGGANVNETSIWYVLSTAAGTPTVTATAASSCIGFWIAIAEYGGLGATALDKTVTGFNNAATSHTSGSVTTTVPDLLVGAYSDSGDSITITAGTSYTSVQKTDGSATVDGMLEDQGVGGNGVAAGSLAATFTSSAASSSANVFASFKFIAAGNLPPGLGPARTMDAATQAAGALAQW